MTSNSVRGLASIIIPCWGQLEFTRKCIPALFRQTGPNWELIVINNGSTDGTGDYLAGVQDASPVPVTVIANATNRGFPAAINQGLQYARGEYLVLLNNDVVVTDGWLDQLTALTNVASEDKHQISNLKPQMGTGGFVHRRTSTKSQISNLKWGPVVSLHREDKHQISNLKPQMGTGGFVASEDKHQISNLKPQMGTGGFEPLESHPFPGRNITVVDLAPGDHQEPGSVGQATTRIGLVGPMSNYAAPPQLVADVPYQDLDDMKAFARRWRDEHRGKWFTVPKLSGFCLLMKRAVYDAIGGLDEQFGLGFFDDDDLALRARRAGFELAVAHDLFVHHFGSRTFVGNGIDAERLLDENAARFSAKWGDAAPRQMRVPLKAFPGGPQQRRTKSNGSGPKPGTVPCNGSSNRLSTSSARPSLAISEVDRARVSLTMIVRDEEKNLSSCLESVRGLFDEIVVLDTGSKDRTIEIARSFGARVFDFVWVDDFAAARNAALARATGDYAFWLDADDLIEPPERTKLEALLRSLGRGGKMPAYVIRCACDPGPDGSGGDTVVDHIRLFPLIEGVRWTYRVHEQILPALKRAGVPLDWPEITVRHTGYADRALRMRKLDRDWRILCEELAERPNEPFTSV